MYGLKSSEVEKQREKYGSNKLPEKKLKTGFQFFMETFEDRLNQILLAMMIVFTVLAVFGQGSYSEPIGVAVVLLAIAFIGMSTGLKSQKSAKELKDKTSIHYCNVVRDKKIEHINTDDIVVGDLVIIQSGEAIFADGYLVEGNLSVDNSVLNGESEPCKKTAWDKEDSPIAFGGQRKADSSDYTNSYALFSGTTVTDGEGKMIVTNVGVDTVNGQTISTIDEIEETKTSLEIQLEDLAGQISKFGCIGASIIVVALIITNIIQYGGIAEYFGMGWIGILKNILAIAVTAFTIIVAAVPEGLLAIINLITAQNAKVMIKHNVLAKHTNNQGKIETLKDTIEEYKKAKEQQNEIRSAIKQELDELKEEKERTVYQMEADQQIISLHEGMNASASTNESDRMLERVREGAKKTRERAAGAQIAYDTSTEAMDRRMETQERNRAADEVLAEIKRRRNNK